MYQFDWAAKSVWAQESGTAEPRPSMLPRENVARTMMLHWEEHCVECALPQCYTVCPLYMPRSDRKCARFVYGVVPYRGVKGLFDHGADLRFRRWGKLETEPWGDISLKRHVFLDKADRILTRMVSAVSNVLAPINPKKRANGVWTVLREKMLRKTTGWQQNDEFDEFVLECYSPDPGEFRLMLESDIHDVVVFRHAFEIKPGHNFFRLPASAFGPITKKTGRRAIRVYPDNDQERRLIFTWLDFVKYADGAAPAPVALSKPSDNADKAGEKAAAPAAKVKCVVWDLDNTLWKGILVEDGPENCVVRPEAVELIKQLDQRGILQSAVSKNTHEDAMAMIRKLGLEEYFLFPAINWGQKSANLKQIADKLNINIDTFALIDDSPFERAEVESALPMVRTFKETQVGEILSRPEFDVPITSMSAARRQSYLVEMQRDRAAETFAGDYEAFLRSTGMKLRLFIPRDKGEIDRCLELVLRSNQLNLSSKRYTAEQFSKLLTTPGLLNVALECEDRFGRYGIVGFCSVDERGEEPVATDFVLSCRVAQKKVERALYRWVAGYEKARGRSRLIAELVKTKRNGALLKVFDELPFKQVRGEGDRVTLELALDALADADDVIDVRDDVSQAPALAGQMGAE